MGVNATQKIVLLTAASATGSGVLVPPGMYSWHVYGTWAGATAQLQFSPDGGGSGDTWIDFDGISLTADGGWTNVSIGNGHVRVAITGTPTSLNSDLRGVA